MKTVNVIALVTSGIFLGICFSACGGAIASSDPALFENEQIDCTTIANTLAESRACRCGVQRSWQTLVPSANIEATACDASVIAIADAGDAQ